MRDKIRFVRSHRVFDQIWWSICPESSSRIPAGAAELTLEKYKLSSGCARILIRNEGHQFYLHWGPRIAERPNPRSGSLTAYFSLPISRQMQASIYTCSYRDGAALCQRQYTLSSLLDSKYTWAAWQKSSINIRFLEPVGVGNLHLCLPWQVAHNLQRDRAQTHNLDISGPLRMQCCG